MPNFIQNRREARRREEATQRKIEVKRRENALVTTYNKIDKEYVKLKNQAATLEEEILDDFAHGEDEDAKDRCNTLHSVNISRRIYRNLRSKVLQALNQLRMATSVEEAASLIGGIDQVVGITSEMVRILEGFGTGENVLLGELLAEDTSVSNDESEALFNTMKDRFLRSQETSVGSTQDVHNSSSHKTEN